MDVDKKSNQTLGYCLHNIIMSGSDVRHTHLSSRVQILKIYKQSKNSYKCVIPGSNVLSHLQWL